MVVGRIVLKPNLYLDGAEHGTESKDGGAVPYCGFTVKCSLGVHQQDGNLDKINHQGKRYHVHIFSLLYMLATKTIYKVGISSTEAFPGRDDQSLYHTHTNTLTVTHTHTN